MCKFKSFVLFKDQIIHSIKTDSHDQILSEHGIPDDKADPRFVRVEFIPPTHGADDLSKWAFNVDQDVIPDWFDATEQRARVEEYMRINIVGKQVFFNGSFEAKYGTFYAGRNSRVVAWENSRVVAWENSSVEAWENSSVEARENSSVVAWDNSRVVARDNSRVVAWENSSVVAWDNSRVVARDNSRVVAWENSSVEARENSRVVAWENSSVVASMRAVIRIVSCCATVHINKVADDAVVINMATNEITVAADYTIKMFSSTSEG